MSTEDLPPVTNVQESPTEQEFGELVLTFTTQYDFRWNDGGSGSDADGAFYHPRPPEGFHALGSIGVGNYGNPDGRYASICVKASEGDFEKNPLVKPERYDLIWKDSGSGADHDGSCWRPVAPDGYVALGDVFVAGYGEPSTDEIRCVAEELVYEGKIGGRIWIDAGSGADWDFGAWQVEASQPLLETPDGIFAANTFTGRRSHAKPESSVVAYNLRLPLPTEMFDDPAPPKLESRTRPPSSTNPTVDRIVTVPFTSISDTDKPLSWKVENSQFYTVERLVDYALVMFINNEQASPQQASTSITTGVSKTASETFSIETGISVTMESGVEAGGFSTKASVTLSLSLGYSTTRSVTEFRSETDQVTLAAPPDKAAAVWVEVQELRVRRADGSLVSTGLSFDPTDTAYRFSEYPKASSDGDQAASLRRYKHRLNREA